MPFAQVTKSIAPKGRSYSDHEKRDTGSPSHSSAVPW